MKALICDEPGRLSLIERAPPSRAENEVLVRIRHIGICGTDFHIYAGKHPFLEYPRVMGHELSGTVAEAPAGSRLKTGDPVYIVPYLSCGACHACRKGLSNACQNIRVLGVHCDGGMAEYVSVPETNVVPTGGISLADAAMIEFLAIGAHGVKRGNIQQQDRVLVTGSGPIGMSAIIFAKARGAHVTVMDTREDRLAFAVDRLTADQSLFADASAEAEVERMTGGDGFDVVIDATGNAIPMQRGFNFLAHGARYVLLSVVRQDITFSDPEFHKREATLIASRNAQPDDFAEVVRQIEAGKVPTRALNTHTGHLDDGVKLFQEWSQPQAGVIKAILEIG
ncbi:alcohol dehydrogenase catalytic domain-containing protein [Agrobacterium vitis]|uniref:Alcohol dehydrogenase catalytic domain-containing protein n=1 Tax=Agrobacterium vitis TaxID=373 RepID=A0ABD6GBJ3_AGRVI|nr:zinc-binding alcohol dehydrogenase family protein [Agrobacterium vitis]MUO78827.1 alcohol dehydrogenase catalytic domain-containing protein [Agrobacterium vitis]MUO94390.1 alcohol dehydrogenase catalytic domain-containing protein [Agrobacterium vitis]MUP06049.1 alcohol dehydrogenase catalytic domain-containing protein [Agrobacterium vitis]MUZ82146.1 alcohol dehydrogenase catalytic domain-containing protein [Agrobacterium vitis]MVA11493.1 alcohol dehydrogenase catalytic domain-containing pro